MPEIQVSDHGTLFSFKEGDKKLSENYKMRRGYVFCKLLDTYIKKCRMYGCEYHKKCEAALSRGVVIE